MKKKRFYALDLQHFAETGEGAAAQTGETSYSADAGQEKSASGGKSEFEELISSKFKKEFQKKTQAIIDGRFKNLKALEAYKARADAILSKVGEKYGIEDFDSFLSGGNEEDKNSTLPFETDERDETEEDDGFDETDETDGLPEHAMSDKSLNLAGALFSQAEKIKELYPAFDLRNELKNDSRFARLVSGGLDLRSAYEAVHHGELVRDAMAYTARAVRESSAKSLAANKDRPLENGLSAAVGIVSKTNVEALTAGDILKILKQVENGANISF